MGHKGSMLGCANARHIVGVPHRRRSVLRNDDGQSSTTGALCKCCCNLGALDGTCGRPHLLRGAVDGGAGLGAQELQQPHRRAVRPDLRAVGHGVFKVQLAGRLYIRDPLPHIY